MIDSSDALVDAVLRSTLLSSDLYGDDSVDCSYPPAGFRLDPSETVDARKSYLRFVLDHASDFSDAMGLLADDESRELLLSLILFRILGYRRARVGVDAAHMDEARSRSDALAAPPSPLDTATEPDSASMLHFEVPEGDALVKVDCLRANVYFTFFLRQYYFRRSGVTIAPALGDTAIDGGACFGDTALSFATDVGPSGQVYSFEILQSHLDIMRYNLAQNQGVSNIQIHECALLDCDTAGSVGLGDPNPGYRTSAGIATRTLDSLVKDGSIPRVDFLKMDMEGAELAALRGAERTIRRFRPKLAISIYHAWEDYFTIPRFISGLGVGYRMYLENYTKVDGETVLYATCEEPESDGRIAPAAVMGTVPAPPLDNPPEPLS